MKKALLLTIFLVSLICVSSTIFAHDSTEPNVASGSAILLVGNELSDEELASVDGEYGNFIAGAVIGAAQTAYTLRDEKKDASYVAKVAGGAVLGAVTYGTCGIVASTVTSQVGIVASTIYSWGKTLLVDACYNQAIRR